MMKKMFSILLALLLCASLAVPVLAADAPRLVDDAGLLTSSQERSILAQLDEISENYQVDVVIVTVDSAGIYGPDWFAETYYDQYGYGFGPDGDGVMLLLAMEDRDYRIVTNGFGHQAITNSEIYEIGDRIQPHLSAGDYADAFRMFAEACEYEINGEINGFPFDFGMNLLICLVIGLVAAAIATGIMAAQLRSVRHRYEAGEYTRPGSMRLSHSGDLFLYRTVDRRRRQTESSGSRGGRSGSSSSRGIGGGKF